jgi:hypothetical protein
MVLDFFVGGISCGRKMSPAHEIQSMRETPAKRGRELSKSYYENLYKSTHPNIEEVKTYIDNTKIKNGRKFDLGGKIKYRRVRQCNI